MADERHMTSKQVADLFRVGMDTVARWADIGKLPCTYTPGGHRRFDRDEVEAFYERTQAEQAARRAEATA